MVSFGVVVGDNIRVLEGELQVIDRWNVFDAYRVMFRC